MSRTARPRGRYRRWRIASLVLVHVFIAAHIAHFLLAGRTLAPLEVNEVLYTAHAGIVTAGFVLMALALASVLVFGRFFCSWGCHLLALEDACAWILRRLRVQLPPLRSRTLAFVPFGALVYLFVWPHVVRIASGEPLPPLRILGGEAGWSSFVTDDFFRNLPTPGVALTTLVVCGGLVVWLFGTRAFCAYGCPWGALFALADRVAPGRIVRQGDCDACGACTAACDSGIDVSAEVRGAGRVVSTRCLRDLDCVDACPRGALRFGFARPPLGASAAPRPYDFTVGEDVLLGVGFVAGLLVARGLYDVIPFLLALGLGAAVAWGAVLAKRLVRDDEVTIRSAVLRRAGRLTGLGRAAAVALVGSGGLLAHSAVVRWHEHAGQLAFERVLSGHPEAAPEGVEHFRAALDWGLFAPASTFGKLATLERTARGEPRRHVDVLARARARVAADPTDSEAVHALGRLLAEDGRDAEAAAVLLAAAELRPESAEAWNDAGAALGRVGRDAEALDAFERAVSLDPDHAHAHANLGLVLAAHGHVAAAEQALLDALRIDPSHRPARLALSALRSRRAP